MPVDASGIPASGKRLNVIKPAMTTTATTSALLLVIQQFGSRGLTFVANQILLRYLSPQLLGISSQLELYSITVLFFSRESLRVSLQRQSESVYDEDATPSLLQNTVTDRNLAGRTQAIVNLAYVSLALGIFAALALGFLFLGRGSANDSPIAVFAYMRWSLVIYGIASVLELAAEPCYVVVQQRSQHGIRAIAESLATLARSIVTCASAIYAVRNGAEVGVLPFALGQLAYALFTCTIYYLHVIPLSSAGGFSLLPKPVKSKLGSNEYAFSYLSISLLSLSRSFFVQSLFKHILTQGDTFIVSVLSTPHVQGVYTLANNYGGLVARILMQPVEEVSRNYFGKLLSFLQVPPTRSRIAQAVLSLRQLLYSYIVLSIFVVALGPTIAPWLLQLVAGPRWIAAGAGRVLAAYCYYIPLLAINGISEAFVTAVATEPELHRQTAWMFVFSLAFAVIAALLLNIGKLGALGLVYANCFNMVVRIIWATMFIQSYLNRLGTEMRLDTLVPRPLTLAVGACMAAAMIKMKEVPEGYLDWCKWGMFTVASVSIIATSERRHLVECYHKLQTNRG